MLKDESKKYPCNETGYEIRKRLNKVENITPDFLCREKEQRLWHLIYSVTDKEEYKKALESFAREYNIDITSFVENFIKFPPFKSEYGSYSEKAIKRLLPLIRLGKYWNWDAIDGKAQERIKKLINGEWDETINQRVREKAINLSNEIHFQGLQLWLASYIVYDLPPTDKWNTVVDLQTCLNEFKQHSLRNPIVEQVVTETLRVVKDIWQQYGNGASNFFDEIHIELGRDLKNTADERKRLSGVVTDNENTNLRIKALLIELMNDTSIENVRPYSPMQQEILKIYEDGVLSSEIEIDDDILKISKKAEPTKSELQRYKLWMEQKYRSPYTGQIIPLYKLFTSEYEIEHIIPQSRYFDDSFSNKVICEAAVNTLKSNLVGLEFIKNHHGEKVSVGFGKNVQIFSIDEYKDFVDKNYSKNRSKRNKLLLEDIPEKMVERQLNDTRYISKYISALLSNIVRSNKNDEGINSKNLIPGNGKITTQLKQDWGLNDVWNDLILPRFERMNTITNSNLFTSYNSNHQKHLPSVPFEYSKGFQKKRIDHRHHSLDALVIACATREHFNYMSNKHAIDKNKSKLEKEAFRYDLRNTLCHKKYNNDKDGNYSWVFKKPWDNFTLDAKEALNNTLVSFKQNLRVINKATNEYESYKDENGIIRVGNDGKPNKGKIPQKGINWAIRKQLHKDTVSGAIILADVKVPKDKILTATRKCLDSSFNLKAIESITDSGIKKILINYLQSKDNNPEIAFSPEGIEDLNNNIRLYNKGKYHQPIIKVRVYEVGSKFPLGETENKKEKYVEAAKGTNLFFSVYRDECGKRNYETIPLNEVIEHQKWRATLTTEEQKSTPLVPIRNDKGQFLFFISPNDLVYVPSEDEDISTVDIFNPTKEQIRRIYKMVSCTGSECHFIHANIASLIKNYDAKTKIGELGSLNKQEVDLDGQTRIKEKCLKLKVGRLGNIISVNN
jgi:CRISPR-associated endonuclease Csn1